MCETPVQRKGRTLEDFWQYLEIIFIKIETIQSKKVQIASVSVEELSPWMSSPGFQHSLQHRPPGLLICTCRGHYGENQVFKPPRHRPTFYIALTRFWVGIVSWPYKDLCVCMSCSNAAAPVWEPNFMINVGSFFALYPECRGWVFWAESTRKSILYINLPDLLFLCSIHPLPNSCLNLQNRIS